VARQIVPGRSRHDGDVRLRLRFVVQRDGKLDPHSPAGPEGGPQGAEGKLDGRRVRRPLRFPDNELATDQLDAPGWKTPHSMSRSYCKRVQRLVGRGLGMSPSLVRRERARNVHDRRGVLICFARPADMFRARELEED
jgi:hypothetical protein